MEMWYLQYGILRGILYLTSPYFDNKGTDFHFHFIPGTDFNSAHYDVAEDVDCPGVWRYCHKS